MSAPLTPVSEGSPLPDMDAMPDLLTVIRYCALGWTFPAFFFDEQAARAQGMPGTLVPGPLKLGFLHAAVERWLNGAGRVCHVRAAYRRPDLTGRPLTITGSVASVYTENGLTRAGLDLAVVNAEGQPSVRGFAVVELFGPPAG